MSSKTGSRWDNGGGGRPKFLKPAESRGERGQNERGCMQDRAEVGVEGEVGGRTVFNNPYASLSIQHQRPRMPIFKNKNHILYLLEKYQTLIIVGETGCGKSTQIPQYLLENGWAQNRRVIGVTQPRRVAVVTLANRVSEERMSLLGGEVGYVVRFDECFDQQSSKIKFMTDGILLREILADPLLTKYSVLMIDEAHERTQNTDIILGLLRKVVLKRKDLRLIVSSATLDAEVFRNFFNTNETKDREKDTAVALSVEGRQYPVKILYAKSPCADFIQATVKAIVTIHKTEPVGDVLAFLTGMDEVERACQLLRDEAKGLSRNLDRLWILPMYGALPAREQLKVFDSSPAGTRKIVIATNIAEASITIPGISYVIDCGFVKVRCLNQKSGIESLMVVPISKASAEQRAGRAGRIKPGKAYRLYPEAEFGKLLDATVPEIQRTDLAAMILQMKALGVENVVNFHYLSRPPSYSMIRGVELLFALGAVDRDGHLTAPLGVRMAECPLAPMHAKALLSSGEFECSEEILSIIAMLQIEDVFSAPPPGKRHAAETIKRKFSVAEGDHMTFLNIMIGFIESNMNQQWCSRHYLNYRALTRAVSIRKQLKRILERYEIPIVSCRGLIGDTEKIRRCLVSGFFCNAAKFHYSGYYRTVRDDYPLKVYKGSAVMYREEFPQWIIFNQVLQDSVRDISVIDPEWLYELAPQFYEFGTVHELARKRARLNDEND